MHRRHTKAQAYELIDKLRQAIPDLALRTTLLVGYPGETEADFEELLEFVRTVGSNDWAYSPIPKRREPIRPGICRTMFRKRSNKVV